MGDISVTIFSETLKQLLATSNLDFTMEEKSKVQSIVEEITYLRSFLRAMEKERNNRSEVMKMVVQIRDAVSEAENVVELFIVLVSKGDRASNYLREPKDHPFLDLERVGKGIKDLAAEVEQNYDEMGNISLHLFLETLDTLYNLDQVVGTDLGFTREEYKELRSLTYEVEKYGGLLNIVEKKHEKHSEVIKVVMQIKEVVSDAEKAVKSFIEYAVEVSKELFSTGDRQMKMVVQIRVAVYEAENVVERFKILDSKGDHASNYLRETHVLDLVQDGKDIKDIAAEVEQNYDEHGNISLHLFVATLETLNDLEKFVGTDLGFTREEYDELRSLRYKVENYRGLLNIVEKKHEKHSEVIKVVMQMKEVVSDAEKAVKLFIEYVSKDHASNYRSKIKAFRKPTEQLVLDLERVKEDIKNLTSEVRQICNEIILFPISGAAVGSLEHSSTGSRGGSGSLGGSNPSEVVKEKVVVGFEEQVSELLELVLNTGYYYTLETISIIGPGGCGKTTLAREVYDHPWTSMKFEIRAWVVVPQNYDMTMKRDLLIDILKSVSPENHRDYEMSSEHDLGEKLHKLLKGKKYLIVMDNIWGDVAWTSITGSFPRENIGSEVVFTSRKDGTISIDGVWNNHHRVKPLSKICSWELLKVEVFGKKSCPLELVEIGKQIANKCEGLPLAIVSIAGILATKEKIPIVWQQIAIDVSSTIAKHEGCMQLLELSYKDLPLHLKACFLYIGAHLEDYEISVRELTWLWIAEGFIRKNEFNEWKSLEGIAEDYLLDLIKRNLVTIARRSSTGENKTCRIHNLLRQLCLRKAEEENFFAKIDGDDSYICSAINNHRRLFVFRQFFDKFFFSRSYPQNLRSFLCFGSRHSRIELYMSFFVETFKLLRVFSFVADECRGEILRGQLVHLRYLALRLPEGKQFGSLNPFHFLSNLEILNLQVSCMDKISLPRDIVKMVKLRHLYSKGGIFECHHVCYDEDEGNMLDSLQTLHRMCICEHCQRFLERTPNLEKLGLIGDPDRKGDDVLVISDLEFLKCLSILRVESVRISSIGLRLIPRWSLRQLSLKQTNLKWEQLSILLQSFRRLEVLKLLTGACRGPVWDTSENGFQFPKLSYLKLDGLDIEEWKALKNQFGDFETLVIRHCKELKGIPIEFAYSDSLRKIQVEWSSHSVEESARKIQEKHPDVNLILRFNAL